MPTPARPLAIALALAALATRAPAAFVTFETGQVRPLALSPDQSRLFAVNTPDNRLEIFTIDGSGALTHAGSVPVGMEPTAVAARTNGEVWVVNHLSDSVSIVNVASTPPRVTRTLLVCDEPRDIVFAGPGGNRAFVTAARRGQNCRNPGAMIDPLLTTADTPRALVQVFDATNLGATLEGTPLTVLELFGDTPRALAVAPGGNTVYAAVFHSGNRSTALSEGLVCNGGAGAGTCTVDGFTMPGGLPFPNPNSCLGQAQPETGMIVQVSPTTGNWEDTLGRNWNGALRFDLPDFDVFAINAAGNPPAPSGTPWASVGTILFNMVVNPISGRVYVSNTEARNLTRFEGSRTGSCTTSTVRGHLHEARVTVLDGASVNPRHLNKHLAPYNFTPTGTDQAKSLATPLGMATDGTTLYVAAFGSSQIGIFSTALLESDGFTPNAADHITVSGGGPTGLVLRGSRLYALTRFDNAISVIDTTTRAEIAHLPLFNPEPASVVDGRPVLYDAVFTSANGEASCAACHVFGDFDSLAWDLGDPDGATLNNPNPIEFNFGQDPDFRTLKGPMTTQSLRGMANHGPMHWRGDRTGGNDPGGDPLSEEQAFEKFNVAFGGLLGRGGPIPDADMQRFTDFILQVTYPPNPIRSLTNALTTTAQQNGRNLYFGRLTDSVRNCNGCHVLDPAQGFFGSDGDTSFENEPQMVKIPHLRNMYQKVGMFGMPAIAFIKPGDNGDMGDQVRGFGFLHDGSIDTMFRFHNATVFDLNPTEAAEMEQFMFAFDSNLAPIAGQQTTLSATSPAAVGTRIGLMIQRAAAVPSECELVVKGTLAGEPRGWLRLPGGSFRSDRAAEPLLTDAQLRAQAASAGQERTYTCVPPGSGTRIGIDRDEDGCLDGDDPAPDDAGVGCGGGSTTTTTTSPTTTTTTLPPRRQGIATHLLLLRDDPADDTRQRAKVIARYVPLDLGLGNGSADDPVLAGGSVRVFTQAGDQFDGTYALPAANWRYIGAVGANKGYKYKDPARVNGPVKRVIVKAGKVLRFSAAGPALALGLVADPSPVRAHVTIGGKLYCMLVGVPGEHAVTFTSPTKYRTGGAGAPPTCP